MATKEFREFFFRSAKLNTGTKKDQEVNYPTTYTATINGVSQTVGNRLLKNHFPSEGVFRKWAESIAHLLNSEDTATATTQGLVSFATTSEFRLGTGLDAKSYALVPTTAQCPITYFVASVPAAPPAVGTEYKVGDLFVITDATDALYGNIYRCTATTPTFTLVFENAIGNRIYTSEIFISNGDKITTSLDGLDLRLATTVRRMIVNYAVPAIPAAAPGDAITGATGADIAAYFGVNQASIGTAGYYTVQVHKKNVDYGGAQNFSVMGATVDALLVNINIEEGAGVNHADLYIEFDAALANENVRIIIDLMVD